MRTIPAPFLRVICGKLNKHSYHMLNLSQLTNPVFKRSDNLRDPSVLKVDGGYWLYYTRYSNGEWNCAENWSVASVFTKDFKTFEGDRDITPKNFGSPGDPTWWHGRLILPFQSYPAMPQKLHYAVCKEGDGKYWSDPIPVLEEVLDLPWNGAKRAIDISLTKDDDTLHAWFVGNAAKGDPNPKRKGNLLGHAMTKDPELKDWTITSYDQPLIENYDRAPDGVENVVVYRTGDHWTMMLSEGIANQHIAYAVSNDLIHWNIKDEVPLPKQHWLSHRYGAPFVWQEENRYYMVLMGEENAANRSSLGLLHSKDGLNWTLLPEN